MGCIVLKNYWIRLVPGALLVLAFASGQAFAEALHPDLILHNAKIVTVDTAFRVQQAVAIQGDKIVAVGTNAEIVALRGPRTKLLNLHGRTVIPGLIDDHYHMLTVAVDNYLGVEVALAPSIADMLKAIQAKAAKTPPGETVYTTSGWLPEQLAEKRPLNRFDLDAVAPNNPVFVKGGHTAYLNTLALKQMRITKDTVSPAGGYIEKDPTSAEPTGALVDNAIALASALLPVPTHEQKLQALQMAQQKENSVGITSIREPGISPDDMRVYQDLWNAGKLTLRVSMNLNLDTRKSSEELVKELQTWGVASRFGDSKLRLDGIGEFGIDGGFQAALMRDPYNEKAQVKAERGAYYGLQRIPTNKFAAVMIGADRLGWRACIHTVGDQATDLVLDAYEKANEGQRITGRRWVLEHAHYTRPDQFDRIKKLGVVISTQFHPYMAAQTMIDNWGQERASKAMRIRDWLNAGIPVGGGSDWTLLPANPFWMLYFFVTRDTRLWGVLGADQRISREEALRLLTISNAYITFEEDMKGSIEPGKLADLVVLSEDYLTVAEAKIRDIKCLMTMLGGKTVYQAPGFNFSSD